MNKNNSNYKLKQKIIFEMMNLGYDKIDIMELIEKNINVNNNIIDKEFNKIYKKLIKKFGEEDALIKTKQKLLSKGFCSDEINNLCFNLKNQ